jgi:hypothetical protein
VNDFRPISPLLRRTEAASLDLAHICHPESCEVAAWQCDRRNLWSFRQTAPGCRTVFKIGRYVDFK